MLAQTTKAKLMTFRSAGVVRGFRLRTYSNDKSEAVSSVSCARWRYTPCVASSLILRDFTRKAVPLASASPGSMFAPCSSYLRQPPALQLLVAGSPKRLRTHQPKTTYCACYESGHQSNPGRLHHRSMLQLDNKYSHFRVNCTYVCVQFCPEDICCKPCC